MVFDLTPIFYLFLAFIALIIVLTFSIIVFILNKRRKKR